MGYLKSAVESTLVYAEQAKLNDYVTSIRKSIKPVDSIAAQVEALASTHGAPIVEKIDLKLDPVVDAATEKYGMAKDKCTDVIVYAQTKKDGVVSYAVEKKEGVISKAKDAKKTVVDAKDEVVRQAKTGEIDNTIMKKAEVNKYTAWFAKTLIGYKGVLVVNAKTLSTQITDKSTAQIAILKAKAYELKGKLPIATVEKKVAELTDFVTAKSSPYIKMVKPYVTKAKTDFYDMKTKVYERVVEFKKTYLAKKSA
jgi:hypothetical protein